MSDESGTESQWEFPLDDPSTLTQRRAGAAALRSQYAMHVIAITGVDWSGSPLLPNPWSRLEWMGLHTTSTVSEATINHHIHGSDRLTLQNLVAVIGACSTVN